jgi:peptidoglycan/xylan/chitin deacetylase (PgdA/CDA1 family)
MLFRAASVILLLLCLNFLLNIEAVNCALVALLLVWIILSVRGMTSMRSHVFGKVYWRGSPREKCVALSFDDGPTAPSTAQVLDVLSEHDVKATFFVIGENLKKNPELSRRMHEEGHEMGNHTQSHPWMFRMLFSSIREDILLCQDEIFKITGCRPRFFRQPIGINNPSVMKVIDGLGMVMVGWQARAYDAVPTGRHNIVRRILSRVKPGGIILLHDGCDGKTNPDRTATVEALKEIIPALKEQGYQFKTVSELIGIKNEVTPSPQPLSREERGL